MFVGMRQRFPKDERPPWWRIVADNALLTFSEYFSS